MANTLSTMDYPLLRHCTFVAGGDSDVITMIVGREYFEITEEFGPREKFLEVKSYFDGRHSIDEISQLTGVPEKDVQNIVITFRDTSELVSLKRMCKILSSLSMNLA